MSNAWLLAFLGLLAGCSSGSNRADKAVEPGKAGQDSSIAEAKGERWQRRAYKIGDEDYVRFALKAVKQISSDKEQSTTRVLLGCGYLPALVVDVPSSVNGNVKTAFDDAPLVPQKWIWFPKDHFLGPAGGHPGEKRLLAQMMKSRTFKFEFTSGNGSSRLATFNMLDIKDLVNQEPVCDFWLPPGR